MKLNIAIPTYNRNEVLVQNLLRIVPQLTDEVRLFIVDNHSDVPCREALAPVFEAHPELEIDIHRNRYNVGAHANILRCFEYADAEWLWILGDDDWVTGNAVQLVLEELPLQPQAVFMDFRSSIMEREGVRQAPFDTIGLDEFADRIDGPGDINFMSTSVWHIPLVAASLAKVYHYAYSMSHTFALLLLSIGPASCCHFSEKAIIECATNVEPTSRWHYKDFVLGFNTILELPMSNRVRKVLGKKMFAWHPPENVAVYFLVDAVKRGNGGLLYKIAVSRLTVFMSSPWVRFRFHLYRILFLCPRFSWKVIRCLIEFSVKIGLKHVQIEDIEGR